MFRLLCVITRFGTTFDLAGSGAFTQTAPPKNGLWVDVGAAGDAATDSGDSLPGSAIRAYVPQSSLLPSPAAAAERAADGRLLQPGGSCISGAGQHCKSPHARRSSSPGRSSINSPPRGSAPLPKLKHLQPLRPPPPPPLASRSSKVSGRSPEGNSHAVAASCAPQQLFKLPPQQERAHRYERLP